MGWRLLVSHMPGSLDHQRPSAGEFTGNISTAQQRVGRRLPRQQIEASRTRRQSVRSVGSPDAHISAWPLLLPTGRGAWPQLRPEEPHRFSATASCILLGPDSQPMERETAIFSRVPKSIGRATRRRQEAAGGAPGAGLEVRVDHPRILAISSRTVSRRASTTRALTRRDRELRKPCSRALARSPRRALPMMSRINRASRRSAQSRRPKGRAQKAGGGAAAVLDRFDHSGFFNADGGAGAAARDLVNCETARARAWRSRAHSEARDTRSGCRL